MKKITSLLIKHQILVIFSLVSVFLLIIFLTFQYFQFSGLQLDIKWLIVSGIPILIGLIVGEYIKSFKGFGIEIEASLKAEVPTSLISSISDDSIVDVNGLNKDSLQSLLNLGEDERRNISRLRFVSDRRGYYDYYVVGEYIRRLDRLKYVEVVNRQGEFLFLVPISHFRINYDVLPSKVENFINQIEKGTLNSKFPGAITAFVNHDDSLLEAYQKLLSKTKKIEAVGDKKLPVLDSQKHLIGLLSKVKVEEFISKEVLESYKEKKST